METDVAYTAARRHWSSWQIWSEFMLDMGTKHNINPNTLLWQPDPCNSRFSFAHTLCLERPAVLMLRCRIFSNTTSWLPSKSKTTWPVLSLCTCLTTPGQDTEACMAPATPPLQRHKPVFSLCQSKTQINGEGCTREGVWCKPEHLMWTALNGRAKRIW